MQMATSPQVPFRFMQSCRLPSMCSLSPEGGWAHSVMPAIWIRYCAHISDFRGGNQPPPSHAWSGLLIVDMFQDGLKERIIEAVDLAWGKLSCSLEDNHARWGFPLEVKGTLDSA